MLNNQAETVHPHHHGHKGQLGKDMHLCDIKQHWSTHLGENINQHQYSNSGKQFTNRYQGPYKC